MIRLGAGAGLRLIQRSLCLTHCNLRPKDDAEFLYYSNLDLSDTMKKLISQAKLNGINNIYDENQRTSKAPKLF